MKRAAIVLSLCVVVAAAMATTGASYTLPLPAGTAVTVHVVDEISSASASAGQTFAIVVADPVILQGWTVVQKDATGEGHVVAVNPVGKGGHEASISVQPDWVVSVDGKHLALTAVKGKTTPLTFGVGASYAGNFQKGQDVTVGADLVFPAYTSSDGVITINSGP